MSKKDMLIVEGEVIDVLKGGTFKVHIDSPYDKDIIAHISGKMRQNFIRILKGDKVDVELSPYDFSIGRIVYRKK